MSYIYHILSKTDDKSGIYIGQTIQQGYIRPIDHFRSGYRGRGENILFQNFLKEHSFDEMRVEIFTAPNYGLDPKELDAFLSEWYQSYKVYYDIKIDSDSAIIRPKTKQQFEEALRLNAAEILHTYYYQKHKIYGPVCALSMGGQQNASFSKEGIVLNRDLDPGTVASILESSGKTRESLGQLQSIFNKYFKKHAINSGLYQQLLHDWISNQGKNIRSLVTDFFINHLEQIIRNMQDELDKGHVQYGYRISWPRGHAVNFTQGTQSLENMISAIEHHFKYHKARLERDCQNKTTKEVAILVMNFIAQAFENISINSFIKLHIYDEFTTNSICSFIGAPTLTTPEEVVDSLKRISYDYFRRFADHVKREIENIYNAGLGNQSVFRKTLIQEDRTINVLNLPLMINRIRDEYKKAGIRASFITDYDHWLNFAHGMLTVYTKNNGSILGARMNMDMVEEYPLGILDLNLDDDEEPINPAYEFSQATYAYIQSHLSMNRLDLTYF